MQGGEEGSREGWGRGESSDCARGRVSRGRGGRAGDNFSGARAAGRAGSERGAARSGARGSGGSLAASKPRPAPCAAPRALRRPQPPGSQPREPGSALEIAARGSAPRAHAPRDRRKVGLQVSAAAAPHSASGRGNCPRGPEGSLGLSGVQGGGGRTLGDPGGAGAGPRARGYVLARGACVFCIKFLGLAAPVAPAALSPRGYAVRVPLEAG